MAVSAAADANYMMAQLFLMAVNIQADLVLGLYIAVFIPQAVDLRHVGGCTGGCQYGIKAACR